MFGVLYGLSTVALYALLSRAGVPPFYDKLLQVPVLNLSIQLLDRLAHSRWLRAFDPAAIGRFLAVGGETPRRRNLAYMALWAVVFTVMSVAGGVGDRHPGQFVPFWQGGLQRRASTCLWVSRKHAAEVLQERFGMGL